MEAATGPTRCRDHTIWLGVLFSSICYPSPVQWVDTYVVDTGSGWASDIFRAASFLITGLATYGSDSLRGSSTGISIGLGFFLTGFGLKVQMESQYNRRDLRE